MAPEALLYALKVFGCPDGGAGSTFLVGAALDWTLDPNRDADFSDHLDVVNISVGADYTTPDDPENQITARIIEHGVMPVFSAGNGGDFYDIGGGAPESLSVASSRDSFVLRDAIEVTAPPAVAGIKAGQYSVALDYEGVDVTDDVVKLTQADNLDGCLPLNAADAAIANGKIVWLEWDDNDATRRCGSVGRSNNVFAAGATGALFTSQLEHFAAGITGHGVIPVFQMTASVTNQLRPALDAGTLVVRMAGELAGIARRPSTMTSRIRPRASPRGAPGRRSSSRTSRRRATRSSRPLSGRAMARSRTAARRWRRRTSRASRRSSARPTRAGARTRSRRRS